jgi:hypothetical protein
MDKLQRAEAKEMLKSVMKIDRHNFKRKMMTLVMFASGITANGSNFFSPEDFEHLPGIETTVKVAKNLIYGNQLKVDMEQGKVGDKQHHADNFAHKYADIMNGEEGLRAAFIAYMAGLGKEAYDFVTKVAKGQNINDVIEDNLKDIENNGWALKEGVKIAYKHRLETIKNLLSGQSMSDLDVRREAQEALRYFDLDSNSIGTKDNQLAGLIDSYDMQKANEKEISTAVLNGILRPRHNVDAAFAVLEEKIKRRKGLYDPNATVASNSEKYKSGDDRIPPQSEELKTDNKSVDLPKGWALLTKEEARS